MKKLLFAFLLSLSSILAFAQPAIQWQKMLGGTQSEAAQSIQQTNDGGYIVAGWTNSDDIDVTGQHAAGNSDFWVVKLNAKGAIQWQKALGGFDYDVAEQVIQTVDGGFIVAGWSRSADGDVTDNHGAYDCWIVKLSGAGEVEWKKSYGGSNNEEARSIQLTPDGGYILAGLTQSEDGDVSNNHGNVDVWVVKLTSSGELEWERSYGGSSYEIATSISACSDSGYFITGYTGSNDGDITGYHGNGDYDWWVLKLNQTGDIEWQKALGGTGSESSFAGIQANDGGYVAVGESQSSNGDVVGNDDGGGIWVVKLTPAGGIQWQQAFGGPSSGIAQSIIQNANGNYVITGSNFDSNISGNHGGIDAFVMELSESGDIQWQQLLGGTHNESSFAIEATNDGTYILAGATGSNGGDISETHGGDDFWIAKLFFPTSAISGRLHFDLDNNCQPDVAESPVAGWLVEAIGDYYFATLTEADGSFFMPTDTGDYVMKIGLPGPYWSACNAPMSVTSASDTISLDFPIQAIQNCPYLNVDISAPFLRRCFDNNYYVQYCNDGTTTASDAAVEVTLDPYLTYVSSTLPLASQNENVLTFDLGDVAVGECGNFQITAYLDCDSTVLGQTHCTSAHVIPDSLCRTPSPLWDGSSIEVNAYCDGDSVVFTITNVGTGTMPAPLGYIIIEDQIVLMTNEFQLGPGQSTSVSVLASGGTFRLEAQQALEHPSGFGSTGVTVEGCGGWLSLGFFTQWAFDDDPDPFTDVDCQENVGSFDPNDKQGFPSGLGDEHLIEPGQDIEYLIRFQNTGTDTAFKVRVVDVLPSELELASVRPGASNHPYTYDVTPEGWLTFTFDNIQLPDSTTNEAASHGFVRFRASQRAGLSNDDLIPNNALIYFDFNAPVLTNIFKHRIGQVFPWTLVGTEPPVFQPKTQVRIVPNPLTDSALLQVEGIEPGPLNLVLTDIAGKPLRQQTTHGTGFEFQRDELPTGVYFFQIERNGDRVASGKLMVK